MNIYDPRQNYGAEEWRKPTLQDGDEVIAMEPGRIIGNVTYQSHYFALVNNGYHTILLVHHGAGEERHLLGHDRKYNWLNLLSGDDLYLAMWGLLETIHTAERRAKEETRQTYRQAFVDNRLKKRKQRGSANYKVWIEPELRRASA